MPTKRYRLLQNHPYAEKGTIVEEDNRDHVRIEMKFPDREGYKYHTFPLETLDTWLEEVKEEPTCSKEFSEAILAYIKEHGNDGWVWTGESKSFKYWLERHTSKE